MELFEEWGKDDGGKSKTESSADWRWAEVSSQKQRIIGIIGEVCVEGVKGGVDTAMSGIWL